MLREIKSREAGAVTTALTLRSSGWLQGPPARPAEIRPLEKRDRISNAQLEDMQLPAFAAAAREADGWDPTIGTLAGAAGSPGKQPETRRLRLLGD